MTKLDEYKQKKTQLEGNLETIKRDVIITEQSIKQQEELFQSQFGTTDLEELNKINATYMQNIAAKEIELAALEQEV